MKAIRSLEQHLDSLDTGRYTDRSKEELLERVRIVDDRRIYVIAELIRKGASYDEIHDITKMADQLDHSMGSYMTYFQVLCILLAAVMIYLLTKLIIEKNENAISMTKILGYENKEIASLYLLSTSIVVVIADLISVILGTLVMAAAWRMMLFSYSGWFAFRVTPIGYEKMFGFVLIGYLIVMVFDFQRIKKIPMDQALKNME